MRIIRAGVITILFATTATAIQAQEEAPVGSWAAEVALGLIVTSGNTNTESFSGNAQLIHEREYWRHTGKFEAFKSSQEDPDTGEKRTTADRWLASAKSDYKIHGSANYLFVLLTYEDNRFSGYDYQASETVGYGRNIIQRPDMKLDAEVGVGARQRKEEESGESVNDAIVRLGGKFEWAFSASATFGQELNVESGEEATITTSITSLSSQLVGNLAARLAFRVKNVSDVPEDVDKTDTETTANLVYKF